MDKNDLDLAMQRDERRTVALELATSAFVHMANAFQKLAEIGLEVATDAAEELKAEKKSKR
jgi:hypothetical protein